MGALLLHLSRMNSRRNIHGQDAERLQSTLPLLHKANHPGALKGSLEAVPPEAGHVEKDIAGRAIVGQDKTVALCNVKPLDRARNLNEVNGINALVALGGIAKDVIPPRERGLFPHKNAPSCRKHRY
jgi:hypothetical protein